jgi:DnaJ-class molecular chaperone
MSKTPDGRRVYICPTCHGKRTVQVKRAGKREETQTETVDCRTCDGSGQIVGEPA